jgi:hypothetical protein
MSDFDLCMAETGVLNRSLALTLKARNKRTETVALFGSPGHRRGTYGS